VSRRCPIVAEPSAYRGCSPFAERSSSSESAATTRLPQGKGRSGDARHPRKPRVTGKASVTPAAMSNLLVAKIAHAAHGERLGPTVARPLTEGPTAASTQAVKTAWTSALPL